MTPPKLASRTSSLGSKGMALMGKSPCALTKRQCGLPTLTNQPYHRLRERRTAMQVITRDDAKAQGMTTYFTGKPCRHGHITERFTVNQRCRECARVDSLRRYHADAVERTRKTREYQRQNKDRVLAKHREWIAANKERVRQKERE